MKSRHSRICVERDRVVKTADPARLRVEVEKTRRAHEIGGRSGLFRVPAVLEHDEAQGVAVFERIRGLRPVRSALLSGGRGGRGLAEQCARALAAIHRELALPEAMKIPLPPELAASGPGVFLHGDFNGANVCRGGGNGLELVVLDWQMTPRHGGQATHGTRLFDVVWFVNFLLWAPGWRHVVGDPAGPMVRVFLDAYFREAAAGEAEAELAGYARRFFAMKQPRRWESATWRQRPWLPRCRALTERFLASLDGEAGA